jgi:hypothetical protein
MNQYDKHPLQPGEVNRLRLYFAVILGIALLMALSAIGCAEEDESPGPCTIANGDWTYQDNPKIYLRFNDGELLNGAYWADTVQVIETYSYYCNCDTMFLTNNQTGFKHWLTFWPVGDTAAIMNGQYYWRVVFLKRI